MKTPYVLLFSIAFSFLQTVRAADEALHSWTDNQGRTLQASFVKSDGTIVTIKWNGQDVPIPLATLSPESQALAQKLAQAKDAAPSSTGMHSWTDTQGRTLQAIFIKADATTVTLNWNGRIVPIPWLASMPFRKSSPRTCPPQAQSRWQHPIPSQNPPSNLPLLTANFRWMRSIIGRARTESVITANSFHWKERRELGTLFRSQRKFRSFVQVIV